MVLKGRVITGDAMFCQREVCQTIRDRGRHYLFVVKDNQPTLKESITAEFKAAKNYHQAGPRPTNNNASRILMWRKPRESGADD